MSYGTLQPDRQSDCRIIAISGFGGAGKSSLAAKMKGILSNAEIVCVDEFIVEQLHGQASRWEGIDWNRLIREVLFPASNNEKTITYGVYDWTENRVVRFRSFDLPKFLIIEGVGLLRPQLKSYFDYSVWLDVPLETATARGIKRDRELYGVDYEKEWREVWSVNDREYFNYFKPLDLADCILEELKISLSAD